MTQLPEFVGWPKIPRLSRDVVVTEKINGSNGQIFITDDQQIWVGSRNRWLTVENDNFGFCAWVKLRRDELLRLGPGRFYGEWFGCGIQVGYGLAEKRFTLFNTSRWIKSEADRVDEKQEVCPLCVEVVPVLYRGPFDTARISGVLVHLEKTGSVACPGYMRPEGIIIFHTASGHYYKKLIVGDDAPKGN